MYMLVWCAIMWQCGATTWPQISYVSTATSPLTFVAKDRHGCHLRAHNGHGSWARTGSFCYHSAVGLNSDVDLNRPLPSSLLQCGRPCYGRRHACCHQALGVVAILELQASQSAETLGWNAACLCRQVNEGGWDRGRVLELELEFVGKLHLTRCAHCLPRYPHRGDPSSPPPFMHAPLRSINSLRSEGWMRACRGRRKDVVVNIVPLIKTWGEGRLNCCS